MTKLINVTNIDSELEVKVAQKAPKELSPLEAAKIPWRTYLEMQNYNKDKYDMCSICIKEQKRKYNGRTPIQCSGLRDYKTILENKYDADIVEGLVDSLDEKETAELKAMFSPADWFKANVKNPKTYTERWYQVLTMSCSARNKVLRLGRRCIEENQPVRMADSTYKKIKDVNIGDQVISNRVGSMAINTVTNVMDTGTRPLFMVTTANNKTITLTDDHQVLTQRGWLSILEGLSVSDSISKVPESINEKFSFVDIVEIKDLGVEGPVYDITVENDHNFLVDDLVVHNCGKAIPLTESLPTPNGWVKMRDVKIGSKVFDDTGKPCNVTSVTGIQLNRNCYKITFDNGESLVADADHQWAVTTKRNRLETSILKLDLWAKEKVLTTEKLLDYKEAEYAVRLTDPVEYSPKKLEKDPYVLGYWLGSGDTGSTLLNVRSRDLRAIPKLFRERGQDVIFIPESHNKFRINDFQGFVNLNSFRRGKYIPVNYLQGSIDQRLELLRGLMDSAGYCGNDNLNSFKTYSEKTAEGFQELVASLGIKATRKVKKNLLSFKGKSYTFTFKTHLKVFNLERKDNNLKLREFDDSFLYIKKIEKVESVPVKCITVDSERNLYLASKNYVVTHNTYSIVMDLVFRIATAEEPINILVAAPMITMIHEIAKAFEEIARVLEQDNFIKNKKSTPVMEITFFNGSLLQGITTSDEGRSSRGKKADIIWLDEADFIGRAAIEAINAIKMDNPNVEMLVTSTPKGEGNLYNFATQENVKEFHFPSYVIPHYTDELHDSFLTDYSEIAFSQEVMALFGLDQDSVFQQHFIEECFSNYIPEFYNESFVLHNRDRFIVLIGVDWNHDNNGTRIIVVGYDKAGDRFFCIEKQKIAKVNLTQELSVNMVVELNRKYNADHIVCDEGFGIGQVSELRVRGKEQFGKVPYNHPDIKLVDTESVQFGATLEITDPTTQETLKKRTKQYIVELTQKLLEQKRLALDPAIDNELILQMKNYSVYKTGLRGTVFKARDKKIGDHDLDGYMLALYMFDKVYGDYINPKAYEHGVTIPGSHDPSFESSRLVDSAALLSQTNRRKHSSKRKGFKSRRKW